MPLTFTMNIAGEGWIEGFISDDDRRVELLASYISDAPWEMVDRTLALLRGADQVEWGWQKEPGEDRWTLRREGDRLQIAILEFDKEFSRLTADHGKPIFKAETSIIRWATQLKGQLHLHLNMHRESGYKAIWRHPFPSNYAELAEEIDKWKVLNRRKP